MNNRSIIETNFKGINDSTLREGEQYNGSYFSLEEQIQVLNWLYLIGVDTAEVGNPVVTELFDDISILTKLENRPLIMSHIRNKETDLQAAINTGIDGVHILCCVDPKRLECMRVSFDEHVQELVKNIKTAQGLGLVVRVSVEHGLEEQFFGDALKLLIIADKLNVDRIQIADTRGVMMPWEVSETVAKLRKEIKTDIGIHLHNDLGHATSNAVLSLLAGANWIDTTLLGLGERTGIPSLSSLLVNLYSINSEFANRYVMNLLTQAEQYMADITDMKVPHNLTTSKTAWSHKAGIHINALKKQGYETYEGLDPKVVGNKREIVTNSRISGKSRR